MPPWLCKNSLSCRPARRGAAPAARGRGARLAARGAALGRRARGGGQLGAAAERAARLGLGLERFPDHRRLGVLGDREGAEDAAARWRGRCGPCGCPAGATNGTCGMSLNAACGELLEDRRGDAPALGIAAHRRAAGRSRYRRRRRRRACRRRTRRWSGRWSCRSCRTAAGRGRAGRSRCRARPRLRGYGPSDRRPCGSSNWLGRASGGRGIALAVPVGARCNCPSPAQRLSVR